MGRGQIIAHKGDGLYDVRLIYAYRSRVTDRLALYTTQMAELDTKIAAETDANKRALLKLQRASIQKLYDYYSTNMPADPTVEAWCADLTEDLTGNVGTVEIPGEPVTILVRPGYSNRAVYSGTRDGQLMPAIAGSPHQVLFNWMLLPGWQRHKPIYRIGTIIDGTIDHDAHTCSVCLDPAYSSQQYLPAVDGLAIGDCGGTNPVTSQVADFCANYPDHPFCTNTDEGVEINLTDAQLAQLKAANLDVNQSHERQGDPSGFKLGDSWDVMGVGDKGDCEDFALTKMQKLVDDYGWNPANLKIVTSYMQDGTGHAFLAVRTSNKGLVALDVNYDNVIESGKLPYRVDKIALTKDTWRSYTRRLDAVAVEYMTCNSWAFAAGDRVVVEFPNKNYTSPKVVGFEENPQPCDFYIWRHGVVGVQFSGVWKYSITQDAWTQGVYTPDGRADYGWPDSRTITHIVDAIASDEGGNQWIFGGGKGYDECPNQNFAKKCLKFNTVSEAYSTRADHPAPGRPFGQCSWYIGGGSYLVAGLLVDTCYIPDPENPSNPPENVINDISCKDDNDFFNDTLNTWTAKQSLPNSIEYGFDFAIAGIGYVGGGKNLNTDQYFSSLYAYDPATNIWASKNDLPRNLSNAQGAQIGGKGYTVMGLSDTAFSGDSAFSDSDVGRSTWQTKWLSEYDPLADTWAAKSQGYYRRIFSGAVGIEAAVWSHYIEALQRYDTVTGAWTNYTAGTVPGWDHNRLAR